MMKKKCDKKGCEREARFAPKIYIPARGFAAIREQSASMYIGLEMCYEHAENFDPGDLENIEEIANAALRVVLQNPVPCDIERAWVIPIRLDSKEFLEFKNMSNKSKGV